MPRRPRHPCNAPGCGVLIEGTYCDKHTEQQTDENKQRDKQRGNSNARGYGYRWRKVRETYLALNPLCKECERLGRTTQATVVDHIQPHRGDSVLFWNPDNWQPLCKKCHDKKTRRGL